MPEINKKTYTDSLNKYYHNLHLPAYFLMGTSAANNSSQISSTNTQSENEQVPFFFKTEGRNIMHLSGDEKNKDIVVDYVVYVDGKAPVSKVLFNASNKFKVKDKICYGKGLKLKISAKDEISGVAKTFISLNGEDFKQVTGEFEIYQEGDYTLHFFSSDNVGNAETVKAANFSVDYNAPVHILTVVGLSDGIVISPNSKLILNVGQAALNLSKIYYKIDDGVKSPVIQSEIPISNLENGNHHIEYFTEDSDLNRESTQFFDFYLDKNSPLVTTDILGDKFIVNNKIYFSGRTKLKFTAVDNKSGVQEIFYSLNGKEFLKYSDPFYMPTKAGEYSIKYYAFDKMGNQGAGNPNEKIAEYKHHGGVVYVDLTGPTLSHALLGPYYKKDGLSYVTNKTLIKLAGADPESGLQKITFRFDSTVDEVTYNQPFTLPKDVYGKVEYFGYDNVNNRNLGRFNFTSDNDGPELSYTFTTETKGIKSGVALYPPNTALNVIPTDQKAGVSFSMYAINGEPEKLYKGQITGFNRNTLYKIKFRSVDHLANKTIIEIVFKTDNN